MKNPAPKKPKPTEAVLKLRRLIRDQGGRSDEGIPAAEPERI